MSGEFCDECHDIDADWYYDCDNCHKHLCERCYGDITKTICGKCLKAMRGERE